MEREADRIQELCTELSRLQAAVALLKTVPSCEHLLGPLRKQVRSYKHDIEAAKARISRMAGR